MANIGSDYVATNREAWERWSPFYRAEGRRAWQEPEPRWGLWSTPESELGLLELVRPGMDVIELGCGTGAVCAWLTRAQANVVGVDVSFSQLETARQLQTEFGVHFRLELTNAETVGYEDSSFDLAISEYGASTWCDPWKWVPEASRLLVRGGLLVFFVTSPLVLTCTSPSTGSVTERLERPYFDMHRFDFEADGAIEFHLGHGDWFKVLRESGFAVENLIEVRPHAHATPRYSLVSPGWARSWPSEDVWIARKR